MLKKVAKFVMKIKYEYYYKKGNYYFRKVDEYGSENNDYLYGKITESVQKEFDMLNRLLH